MRRSLLILSALALLLAGVWASDWRMTQRVMLPDELWAMSRDHRGLLWLGSSTGLQSYDGYALRDWTRGPQLGTGVNSIAEDSVGNLWVGTCDGVVRMDLTTGAIKSYHLPKESQRIIYALFTSHDGTVYVGTDDGFSVYDARHDTFRNYNCRNTLATYPDGRRDTVWGYSVKAFVELPGGDILMGTWADGLLRFSPRRHSFYKYKPIGKANSAYALARDAKGRIWIGSWGNGLWRIQSADDYTMTSLRQLADGQQTIYALRSQDNGTLWMTTDQGIGLWSADDHLTMTSLPLARRILPIGRQRLWAGALSGMMFGVEADRQPISYHPTGQRTYSLHSEDGKTIASTATTDNSDDNSDLRQVVRLKDGTVVASRGDNVEVRRTDGRRQTWTSRNAPWLLDNVYALCAARDGSVWVGQRMGISVMWPDGKGRHIDIPSDGPQLKGYLIVRHLTEDHRGDIWGSTTNGGIVRLHGKTVKHYLGTSNVTACYEDSGHRLWAITAHQGLMRYDDKADRFVAVHRAYHLPAKTIYAINEDPSGALWLAMDGTLVRLLVDGQRATRVQTFTAEDGLPQQAFMPRATCRLGDTLFFGMTDGYIAFQPDALARMTTAEAANLIVSDIQIDGVSLSDMDSAHAARITPHLPMAARSLTIPSEVGHFAIECALLAYSHIDQTTYAYRLEGRDQEWVYAEPGMRRIHFDNLSAGRYTLHLCAIDHQGRRSLLPYTISIHVLAPWYATGWAFAVYALIIGLLAWLAWRYVQMQREVQASRRFTTITQTSHLQGGDALGGDKRLATGDTPTKDRRPWTDLSASSALLAKATQLVREHLDDSQYNRDRMAADMGMSASSLFVKLREATGMNIQTFIQNIRLNAAADLLRAHPDMRISELAYRVGFNTPKYFSQCFKKEFGVLPGDYARQWVERGNGL